MKASLSGFVDTWKENIRGKQWWQNTVLPAYFTDYETYRLKKGDRVFITYYLDENGEPVDVYVTDLVREGYLLFRAALFVFLDPGTGQRGQGVKTIITLLITVFIVVKVLIPLDSGRCDFRRY